MGNIAKNVHSKFDLDATRNDGALGFFQTASPPNNNNNNNNKKISSVWGPVPGPKTCFYYPVRFMGTQTDHAMCLKTFYF